MADWGSKKGGKWASTRTKPKKSRKSPVSGILSFTAHNPVSTLLGNLGTDVKDMAFGLPTGLVGLAEHPVRSVEEMGKTTWDQWSPLFQGDFGKFARGVYDHPLAPILDVLSVVTLGAGTAAKGAKILSEAGVESSAVARMARAGLPVERELRSPVNAGRGAVVHTKHYSANPFIRARQMGQERAVNGLAALIPSMFSVGKDLNKAFIDGAGKTTLRGAERADAWRWFMREKFDSASRSHALQAAQNLYISSVVGASKRLQEDTAYSMLRVVPHMTQQLEDHAHILRPNELGRDLYTRPTGKPLRQALAAEREAMKKAGVPRGTGQWNARLAAVKAQQVPAVGGHLNREYLFVAKDAQQVAEDFIAKYEDRVGWTPEKFHDYLRGEGEFDHPGKSYASQITTDDWTKAARTDSGDFRVVRNHTIDPYIQEAARSVSFLGNVWNKSTTMWKWAVLAARPAYLVNNAAGNMFMYMVSQGPQGFRGLVDAMRQVKRPEVVRAELSRAEKQLFRTNVDWQDRYYLGLHRGFSRDVQEHLGTVRVPIGSVKGRFVRLVGGGLYDITHQVSDVFLRRATVNNIMRARPEVQALMRQGHHFDDAAASVSESRAIREAIQEQVNDVLGQYHYLNPAERAVRAIVPFYTWDRAIARHGVHLFMERPTTAAFMQGLGEQGVETTQEILGEIPEFLNSALPLSLLGFPEGPDWRVPILGTTGLNPYTSLAALVDTTEALLTGQADIGPALAQQVHPFISGAVEATTGTSMLTGARMPAGQGGLIPRIISNTLVSLPEFQVGASIGGPQGTDETLFAKDLPQYLSAFLGVPVKYLNQQAAAQMAERQNKTAVKKKRRRKTRKWG